MGYLDLHITLNGLQNLTARVFNIYKGQGSLGLVTPYLELILACLSIKVSHLLELTCKPRYGSLARWHCSQNQQIKKWAETVPMKDCLQWTRRNDLLA